MARSRKQTLPARGTVKFAQKVPGLRPSKHLLNNENSRVMVVLQQSQAPASGAPSGGKGGKGTSGSTGNPVAR